MNKVEALQAAEPVAARYLDAWTVTLGSAPRVLVLEDEAIIALDIEGILTDAGLDVAATLSSCAGAVEWLTANRPDVAILDIDLQDGSCEHVAQRLLDLRSRSWSSQEAIRGSLR